MFHRLWTLIRKELQSLLREPQTRAILILPVLIQVILFPFAATLEVTNPPSPSTMKITASIRWS